MNYISHDRLVRAWQHVLPTNPTSSTAHWPDWVIEMDNMQQLSRMPDGSIHILDQSNRRLPVPLDYWIVSDLANPKYIEVVAPDRFEAEYQAEI